MSYLESLFTKYGTDKGLWGYTPYYEEVMEKKRFDVKRVLEIGICGYRDIPNNVVGASLFVWRDYFPNAEIYGIDNDGRFIFNDQDRIHTAHADAYNPASLARALVHGLGVKGSEWFDMIVDDAVHEPTNQSFLANDLLPFLKPGGAYFIEEACPYKIPDHDCEKYFRNAMNKPVSHVAICVTPKPEELAIIIK